VKSSKAPYATVLVMMHFCTEHQENEPWLVIGFIVNDAKYQPATRKRLFDYIWERGFTDNLCLRV
jgi:hypothetical protein